MIVYRSISNDHVIDPLSGEGASKYGGRFNSIGVPVIYTAEHRAMSILELAIRQPISKITAEYFIVAYEVPDLFVDIKLNGDWIKDKAYTQATGDELLKVPENLLIRVPSSILNNCFNYLISPGADGFGDINALPKEPILLDERVKQLFK